MQINIGTVKLLGLVPEENAQDFRVVLFSDVQESKAIGAASIAQFLRGNKKLIWTFTVQRAHASAEAAAYFALRHETFFPVQGQLTYVTDGGELLYAGAVATLTDLTFNGATSTHAYRITSGGTTTSVSGGPEEFTISGGATPTRW